MSAAATSGALRAVPSSAQLTGAPAPAPAPACSTQPAPSAPAVPARTFRAITREQFLLRELRIVAQLRLAGTDGEDILAQAQHDNIFQYPTKASAASVARACLLRLNALGPADAPASQAVTRLIAQGSPAQSAQAALYAMARAYAIVWEFLVRVVAWHYATLDYSLTARDVNVFLADMRSEVPAVAAWSDSTLAKTRQVLRSALLQAGQLEGPKSDKLVPVILDPELERAIRANQDTQILPAFNCMEVA